MVAWLSSLVGAVGGFVLVRYLVDSLGITEYGVVELLDTLVVFTMLSDLGLRGALGRHLTEHVARGDQRRVNELLTLSVACYLVIGLALFGALWFAAPWLATLFRIQGAERDSTIWLIRLFVPSYTLAMFVGTSFSALIESYHRFDWVDLTHTLEIVLRLTLIAVAISVLGMGLKGWAAGYLLAKLIAASIYAWQARRLSPGVAIAPRYLGWSASRELFTLGGLMLVYQLVLKLSAQTDPLVLGGFLGPTAVALYKPAFRLITAASPFVAVLSRQFRPLATDYHVQGRHELVHELLVRGTRLSLLLALPFSTVLFCFAFPLVRLWLAKPEFEITAWLLMLWVLADLAASAAGTQFQLLLGVNQVRFVIATQAVAAMVNLGASLALVAWLTATGRGVNACLIAILVPTIATAWLQRLLVTWHVAGVTQLGLWRYLRSGFLPAAVVGAILMVFGIGLNWLARPQSWQALAICAVMVGLVWLALTWLIGLDSEDRRRIIRLARRSRDPKPVAEPTAASATQSSCDSSASM